jgi:transcriptional regulator with XRE-family HTH domain
LNQLSLILKNALETSGMNQTKAAELIGIERKTLNSYMQGRTEPDLEVLGKIARALKIGPEIYHLIMEQNIPPIPVDNGIKDTSNDEIHPKIEQARGKKISLETIADDLQSILRQQVYTRAEIRAFGEYQVMKDSQGDKERREAIMEQINKLVSVNLGLGSQMDSNAAAGK